MDNLEELAFVISLNLIDQHYMNSLHVNSTKDELINFYTKLNLLNYKIFNMKYTEDFQRIYDDIKLSKDVANVSIYIKNTIIQYLIFNSLLDIEDAFIFEKNNLIQKLKDNNIENNCEKISMAVELLHKAGFNLQKLKKFDIGKIHYEFFDIIDDTKVLKDKFERYINLKVDEWEVKSVRKVGKNNNDSFNDSYNDSYNDSFNENLRKVYEKCREH